MAVQKQVHLRVAQEPLQIDYPENFRGTKSGDISDAEFHLSTLPRFLTLDEIAVAEAFIQVLPYSQSLVYTGAVLNDAEDPLLTESHSKIDEVEAAHKVPNSRFVKGGAERSVRERVYLLRERGVLGNGSLALGAAQ